MSEIVKRHEILAPLSKHGSALFTEYAGVNIPLYRYMKYIHFENFLDSGYFELGTLYEYRNEEEYGDEVGDVNEGARAFGAFPDGIPVVGGLSAVNAWILCLTAIPDEGFYKSFKADCYFEIFDTRFFVEISKALQYRFRWGSVGAVEYMDDDALSAAMIAWKMDGGPEPRCCRVKCLKYSHQHEVRAAWEPWTAEAQYLRDFRASSPAPFAMGASKEHLVEAALRDVKHPANFPNLRRAKFHAPDATQYVRLIERR